MKSIFFIACLYGSSNLNLWLGLTVSSQFLSWACTGPGTTPSPHGPSPWIDHQLIGGGGGFAVPQGEQTGDQSFPPGDFKSYAWELFVQGLTVYAILKVASTASFGEQSMVNSSADRRWFKCAAFLVVVKRRVKTGKWQV